MRLVAVISVHTCNMSLNSSTGELMISSTVNGIFSDTAFFSSRLNVFLSAFACFSFCLDKRRKQSIIIQCIT